MKFSIPYGTSSLDINIPDSRIKDVLTARLPDPGQDGAVIVKQALRNPISQKPLSVLAEGKRKITLIASDHTRPVPSKIIIPAMLEEIRKGNPEAEITILAATGCHRPSTQDELISKFGIDIIKNERIVVHDCDDSPMASLGALPSGGNLAINSLAAEADLLVSEGFIEPHFFAGFSGGRKSVMPGVAARETVLFNHNAGFIDSPYARTGILEGNPIHNDMLFAAKAAKLDFIVNVVLDGEKRVIHAVSGHYDEAHKAGCNFISNYCKVNPAGEADIVITSNGGHPLDQNIYQAVKGMTAAESAVRQDGVIIMCAKSGDGHGGEAFFNTFKTGEPLETILARFRNTPNPETIPDQWQSQIFIRVLNKAKVIFVSDADDETVSALRMIPAKTIEQALAKADELLGKTDFSVTVIPDGVSVIVEP